MTQNNPYRLIPENYADLDSAALLQILELPEFPKGSTAPVPAGVSAADDANIRLRLRNSLDLQSGFAFRAPPEHNPEPYDHGLGQEHHNHSAYLPREIFGEEHYLSDNEDNIQDEEKHDFVKHNFFVHNGYRYDGRLYKLRRPQERSQNSQPRQIFQRSPVELRVEKDYRRVYSEAAFNARPRSLPKFKLSTRSASSRCSERKMSADANTPAAPISPKLSPAVRVPLLVENVPAIEEDAAKIRVESPNAQPPMSENQIGNKDGSVELLAVSESNTRPQVCECTSQNCQATAVCKREKPILGDVWAFLKSLGNNCT